MSTPQPNQPASARIRTWMAASIRTFAATDPSANRADLWLAVGLVFVFWLSRLVGLGVFPPFIDEAIHVDWAQQGFHASGMFAAQARLFSIWWYILFQPHHAEAIWTLRAATLLAILPGFAALIAFGRLAAGRWGALLAGLFYLFSTYHMFFDRLALGDALAASAVSMTAYVGYRLSRRAGLWSALLTGVTVFLAIGAKTSVLPYLTLPVLAAMTLKPKGRPWRDNLRWGAVALGSAVILIGALALVVRLFKFDLFSLIGTHNRESAGVSVNELLTHAAATLDLIVSYFGPAAVGFLLVAVIVLILRRRFYLVLCLIVPLLVLWANQSQFSRYFIPAITILLLCGAVALADLLRTRGRLVQIGGIALVLLYGLVQWLPFAWTAAHTPVNLAVAAADRREYIDSDATGFGLADVWTKLQQSGAVEVIGLLSNCGNLELMSPSGIKITCPMINPNGSSVPELQKLVEANRRPGVYVVQEDSPYVPKTIPGHLTAVVERPDGGPRLSIFSLGE